MKSGQFYSKLNNSPLLIGKKEPDLLNLTSFNETTLRDHMLADIKYEVKSFLETVHLVDVRISNGKFCRKEVYLYLSL